MSWREATCWRQLALCVDLTMEAALLKLLSILALTEMVAGGSITAAEGDDVILRCRLDPPVDVSALTVDWKRADNKHVVHTYRHGRDMPDAQTEQYRGRTTLDHEDLKRGVVKLQISSAQLSDSGPYRCYVPKRNTGCVIDLTVEAVKTSGTETSDPTPTGPTLEEVDDRDGVNWRAVCAGVIPVVVVVPCMVIAVLVVRRRMIQGDNEEVQVEKGTSTTDGASCELANLKPPAAAATEGDERG